MRSLSNKIDIFLFNLINFHNSWLLSIRHKQILPKLCFFVLSSVVKCSPNWLSDLSGFLLLNYTLGFTSTLGQVVVYSIMFYLISIRHTVKYMGKMKTLY